MHLNVFIQLLSNCNALSPEQSKQLKNEILQLPITETVTRERMVYFEWLLIYTFIFIEVFPVLFFFPSSYASRYLQFLIGSIIITVDFNFYECSKENLFISLTLFFLLTELSVNRFFIRFWNQGYFFFLKTCRLTFPYTFFFLAKGIMNGNWCLFFTYDIHRE